MKKLVVILMVVALAITSVFAGVKVGASIGRDTGYMGLKDHVPSKNLGAVALGLDVEYVFDEGICLFADGSFVLKSNHSEGAQNKSDTCFAFDAGVSYVLPFDLPFNIEVGAGIKTKTLFAGEREREHYNETMVGGLVKLGVSFDFAEKFEIGFTVSEQLSSEGYSKIKFNLVEYLKANTGFKATFKYAF